MLAVNDQDDKTWKEIILAETEYRRIEYGLIALKIHITQNIKHVTCKDILMNLKYWVTMPAASAVEQMNLAESQTTRYWNAIKAECTLNRNSSLKVRLTRSSDSWSRRKSAVRRCWNIRVRGEVRCEGWHLSSCLLGVVVTCCERILCSICCHWLEYVTEHLIKGDTFSYRWKAHTARIAGMCSINWLSVPRIKQEVNQLNPN